MDAEEPRPRGNGSETESGTVPPHSPSPPPAASPAPPTPEPAGEPEEDWENRYRYLLAEFDNFRKRTEREREMSRRETRALLLRELLPLHDAFDRADEAARGLPRQDPLRRGMELLLQEWDRFLAGERFVPVARVGEPFRPEDEEAVGELPAAVGLPAGSIAEVIQQGFRCPGGLLRPAKVLIARSPTVPAVPEVPAAPAAPA
ncbi:MAG: nucleotide exchange factor GrpE, partial [Thermoplasmata archaeon]